MTTHDSSGNLLSRWAGRMVLNVSGGIVQISADYNPGPVTTNVADFWDTTGGNYIRVTNASLGLQTAPYKIYG